MAVFLKGQFKLLTDKIWGMDTRKGPRIMFKFLPLETKCIGSPTVTQGTSEEMKVCEFNLHKI